MQIVLQVLETKSSGWVMWSYILQKNFCSHQFQTWQNSKDAKGSIQFEIKYADVGV